MTEQEERRIAQRLAENSDIFDFERALEIVRYRPAEAEKLLRMEEENAKWQEESARVRKRREQALREEFG
jgi:hypothetical protein